MLSLKHLEGKGMSAYEAMNSIVEAVQLNMVKGRLSKLLIDESKMDELFEVLLSSEEQKMKAIELLTRLSSRERQCFLMHTVENVSMGKIAKELGISKAAVQIYIERARGKINESS